MMELHVRGLHKGNVKYAHIVNVQAIKHMHLKLSFVVSCFGKGLVIHCGTEKSNSIFFA